ncbi:MAG: ORF6N domain-containing protein [Candidatus Omnitrophota bacterium]
MVKSKSIIASSFITQEVVERKIYVMRDKKVMLDHDLASLYNIPTKALNQAVRRNIRRFPSIICFN